MSSNADLARVLDYVASVQKWELEKMETQMTNMLITWGFTLIAVCVIIEVLALLLCVAKINEIHDAIVVRLNSIQSTSSLSAETQSETKKER